MSGTVLVILFAVLLLCGVYMDVRFRRVPNALCVVLFALGLIGSMAGQSQASTLVQCLLGVGTGLAIWLPFWLRGLLGAGDVKYFGAASSWLGVGLAWRAAVIAALVGGVMSLMVMVWRSGFRHTAETVSLQAAHARAIIANADISGSDAAARTFPYALPMAVAIALAAFAPDRVLAFIGF